jgi:hypothetical protein
MNGACGAADDACGQACSLFGGTYTKGNFCQSGGTTGGTTTGGTTTGGTSGGLTAGTTGGTTTGGTTGGITYSGVCQTPNNTTPCGQACNYQFTNACPGYDRLGADPADCTNQCIAGDRSAACISCLGSKCVADCLTLCN